MGKRAISHLDDDTCSAGKERTKRHCRSKENDRPPSKLKAANSPATSRTPLSSLHQPSSTPHTEQQAKRRSPRLLSRSGLKIRREQQDCGPPIMTSPPSAASLLELPYELRSQILSYLVAISSDVKEEIIKDDSSPHCPPVMQVNCQLRTESLNLMLRANLWVSIHVATCAKRDWVVKQFSKQRKRWMSVPRNTIKDGTVRGIHMELGQQSTLPETFFPAHFGRHVLVPFKWTSYDELCLFLFSFRSYFHCMNAWIVGPTDNMNFHESLLHPLSNIRNLQRARIFHGHPTSDVDKAQRVMTSAMTTGRDGAKYNLYWNNRGRTLRRGGGAWEALYNFRLGIKASLMTVKIPPNWDAYPQDEDIEVDRIERGCSNYQRAQQNRLYIGFAEALEKIYDGQACKPICQGSRCHETNGHSINVKDWVLLLSSAIDYLNTGSTFRGIADTQRGTLHYARGKMYEFRSKVVKELQESYEDNEGNIVNADEDFDNAVKDIYFSTELQSQKQSAAKRTLEAYEEQLGEQVYSPFLGYHTQCDNSGVAMWRGDRRLPALWGGGLVLWTLADYQGRPSVEDRLSLQQEQD